MLSKISKKYVPLYYLSSLGAGGLSVAFWKLGDITTQNPVIQFSQGFFYFLSFFLFILNFPFWLKTLKKDFVLFNFVIPNEDKQSYEVTKTHNPVVSTGWMAMPASFVMLLNASFAILPNLFNIDMNSHAFFGFVVWLFVYLITFVIGLQIILNTFAKKSEVEVFHFGIFLQPLTYGLLAIPGIAMSSMLQNPFSQIALLLGLTSFVIGGLIGSFALIFIIQRFMSHGLPEPSVAPTTLLLMPSVTIYTIFVLRLFHYIGHHGTAIPKIIFTLISFIGIGLMGVAATLGFIILLAYFKNHVPFLPSWWSFICPFVALSVLNSVTYQFSGKIPIFLYSSYLSITIVSFIYIFVFIKTYMILKK